MELTKDPERESEVLPKRTDVGDTTLGIAASADELGAASDSKPHVEGPTLAEEPLWALGPNTKEVA